MNIWMRLSASLALALNLAISFSAPIQEDKEFWSQITNYANAKTDEQKSTLEKKIWATYGKTKAIVVIDTSGFTLRSVNYGILSTLAVINEMRSIISGIVPSSSIIKFDADNAFLMFETPDQALSTLQKIKVAVDKASFNQGQTYKIDISSGIGYGPILLLEHDAFSEILNIASKLGEDTAEAGQILMTEPAYKGLKEPVPAEKSTVKVSNVNITYYIVK